MNFSAPPHQRVPVLLANPLQRRQAGDDVEADVPPDKVAFKYTIEHRPPPPKGVFYADDVEATKNCMLRQKRVRFVEPSPPTDKAALQGKEVDKAEQDAVKFLAKLADDPGLKARKLRSLAKSAGVEFEP